MLGEIKTKRTQKIGVLVCMRARASGLTQIPSPRAFCTGGLDPRDPLLRSERKQGFSADPFYGRARYWPMLGEIKTERS